MRRIAVLTPLAANDPDAAARHATFLDALTQLGWSEGRNVHVETRWSAGDPAITRKHAAELVALAPDVILATGSAGAAAISEHSDLPPSKNVKTACSGRHGAKKAVIAVAASIAATSRVFPPGVARDAVSVPMSPLALDNHCRALRPADLVRQQAGKDVGDAAGWVENDHPKKGAMEIPQESGLTAAALTRR